jgi:hypothetical protein
MIRKSESEKYETVLDALVWQASCNVDLFGQYQMGDEWVGAIDGTADVYEWINTHDELYDPLTDEEREVLLNTEIILIHVDENDYVYIAYYSADQMDEANETWESLAAEYEAKFEGKEDEIG